MPRFDPTPARAPLDALCRRHRVRRLDLFGSAAGDRFDPASSDLDFLVRFDDLPPAAYAEAYFGLLEGLADLYHRPVDLVTEAALANPHLRRRVAVERRTLYGA